MGNRLFGVGSKKKNPLITAVASPITSQRNRSPIVNFVQLEGFAVCIVMRTVILDSFLSLDTIEIFRVCKIYISEFRIA